MTIPINSANDAAPAADAHTSTRPEGDETRSNPQLKVIECPLHTAMRQVAEAAVTQHVLYAEGVYRPREGLAHEMQAWMRIHELVRTSICPATRTGGMLEPEDVEIALAGLPAEMRAKVAAAVRVCGLRNPGEGCPLDAEPQDDLIR